MRGSVPGGASDLRFTPEDNLGGLMAISGLGNFDLDAVQPSLSDRRSTLDRLLDDVTALARQAPSKRVFYQTLTERFGEHVNRLIVWALTEDGQLQRDWPPVDDHQPGAHPTWQMEAARGADQIWDTETKLAVIRIGRPEIRASGFEGPAEPCRRSDTAVRRLAILVPWQAAGAARGLVELEIVATAWASRHEATEASLALAAGIAEVVACFRSRQAELAWQRRAQRLQEALRCIRGLLGDLDVDQTAYRIASDLRLWLGCDRLAVVSLRAGRGRVLAISGAEQVHRHSPSADEMRGLCQRVAVTDQPLWYQGEDSDLPPQVATALTSYLETSPALSLAVVPMRLPLGQAGQSDPDGGELGRADAGHRSPLVGMLVLEQYQQPFADETRSAVTEIQGHCAVALHRALLVDQIPGGRYWIWLARRRGDRRWGIRPWLAAAACALLLAALLLVPAEIRVRAAGQLVPAKRREVFAPLDGVVTAVLVEHGRQVEAGQPLVEMRSNELELQLQAVAGELDQQRRQLSVILAEKLQLRASDAEARLRERRLTAEEQQHRRQIDALEQRMAILSDQQEQLVVRAPIAGQVLTWETDLRLSARPVRRGDTLLTVADIDGSWQVELQVPGRQAGRVLRHRRCSDAEDAPRLSVTLASDPSHPLPGRLGSLGSRIDTDDSGDAYLLATVDLATVADRSFVPGAAAVAPIPAGRGSLAQAWFYELADAIRLRLPF